MTNNFGSLPDRIRTKLGGEPSTREVPMFGGLSFMVNDKLIMAADRDGDQLSFWVDVALEYTR